MRLVLDTDVLVAALRSERGASRQLLIAALRGRYEPLASVPLVVEYEAVLTRPEHLAASGLTAEEVNDVLDMFVRAASPVDLRFLWRPMVGDPNDEMVLETAVNGSANWLVTFNTRHFQIAARNFAVKVCRPAEAWKEIQRYEKK